MIVDIQCIPDPTGTPDEPFAHIDEAIRVIAESGLRHEVSACGTSVEGTPDELWPLVRRVHEATLAAGAAGCISIIKVAQHTSVPLTIAGLTGPHR